MTRRIVALACCLLVVAMPAAPAEAHPFGPPPTAAISAGGRTLTIDWTAPPDDAVAIGERLGLMPEGSVELYRQDSAAQVAPSSRDEARLSAAPQLRAYLAEHIRVRQGDETCPVEVPSIPDFVHEGARVLARCPDPIDVLSLRITLLHDLHDAYRTVATGQQTKPAQSVFTTTDPEHTWRFGVTGTEGPSPGAALGAGALAVLAAAVVVVLLARRRRQP